MPPSLASVIADLPLIAILRGIAPDEVLGIGEALVDAGFLCLEVPLNSPEPFDSIGRLQTHLGDRALIGAGTVLTPQDVARVGDAGGRLIISPNADPDVITATKAAGLTSLPAFATPTEAFAALKAGADGLKLFPAEAASPKVLQALRAVLPKSAPVFVVGGVAPDSLKTWRAAGATGFGLGSALYRPGFTAAEVGARAKAFVQAWRKV